MKYVYVALSELDLCIVRLSGAGLGNILFPYARAVTFAKRNNCQLLWPTWRSFRIGPIIRREYDKRFYHDLFVNNSQYISGLKKTIVRIFLKKYSENQIDGFLASDKGVIVFEGFGNLFDDIKYDSSVIFEDIVKNLNPKNLKATLFNPKNSICVHVRLGDFSRATEAELKNGKHNSSIPIGWYVKIIFQIRQIMETNVKVYIFSDGSNEELSEILKMDNVERITFGTSISDIIALSKAKLFIASGSSFSMWARYLGRMTTIMYKNQVKQKILHELDDTVEIETEDLIPKSYYSEIRIAIDL